MLLTDLDQAKHLHFNAPHLEHQLFPHLFPLAQGGFIQGHKGMTLGKYNHLPLLHVDRRWAHAKMYPFFLFDRCKSIPTLNASGLAIEEDRALPQKMILFRRAKTMQITITSCLQLCQGVLGTGRKNGLVWLLQFRDATLFCHPHSK